MSDWEIGDKVYYFWHANDCSLIWNLNDFILKEDEVVAFSKNGTPRFAGHYDFHPGEPFYKSKNEAIDAMIEHLRKLKDDYCTICKHNHLPASTCFFSKEKE